MSRGDSATTSATGQAAVVIRRESAPTRTPSESRGGDQHLLSRRKFGPRWAGTLAGSVLLASGAYHGLASIKDWVRNREPFPVTVENVRIIPEPPAWLSGAREKVLAVVPELANSDHPASLLRLDAQEIARKLRMGMPWLETVDRVVLKHPGTVEVHVTFRRPIMSMTLSGKSPFLLDRNGVILSDTDVSKPLLDSLIQFNFADKLVQHVVAQGGKAPGSLEVGQIWDDQRIGECLKLASFLTEKSRKGETDKPMFRLIDGISFRDQLIVKTYDGLWIYWGSSPGKERPSEPNADSKWRSLTAWLETHRIDSQLDTNRSYLIFEKDRAILDRK
jgi:hypothetical protein